MASQSLIYVIFRGSKSIVNWIDDMDVSLTDYPYCSSLGCQVHDGFYSAEVAVADQVMQGLTPLIASYPDYNIIVTGQLR